eukprot:PITA_28205
MWTALTSVYQSSNENRKMVLKEKLKAIKMANTDSATTYLTNITSVRDELAAIGEIIAPTELVRIALNGLPKTWENFVDGIVARENLPDWERLWDDCIQSEIRKNHLGATKKVEEDDCGIVSKRQEGQSKEASFQQWRQKQSGASHHMTGVREYFSELSKGDTDMEVVLGDDSVVRAIGVGTLTFDSGPKPPLKVSDVLYVPGIKKNLISVSALEDRGYDVLF